MTTARQNIVNGRDIPIYVSVEPAPECFELEPGETLTLVYDVPEQGAALTINIIDEGIVVLPAGDEPEVLINGVSADERSWNFTHV
jgi:hypothetical protein